MIWGAQISEDLDHSLRVMLIVTGVKSSQIVGLASGYTPAEKKQAMHQMKMLYEARMNASDARNTATFATS